MLRQGSETAERDLQLRPPLPWGGACTELFRHGRLPDETAIGYTPIADWEDCSTRSHSRGDRHPTEEKTVCIVRRQCSVPASTEAPSFVFPLHKFLAHTASARCGTEAPTRVPRRHTAVGTNTVRAPAHVSEPTWTFFATGRSDGTAMPCECPINQNSRAVGSSGAAGDAPPLPPRA